MYNRKINIALLFIIYKNMFLQISVRAVITVHQKMLLVSNDGNFWYTPGGKVEPNEDLRSALIREVKEETGLNIKVQDVIHIVDFFDYTNQLHKVEVYFLCKTSNTKLTNISWNDRAGIVQFTKFKKINNILPTQVGLPLALLKKLINPKLRHIPIYLGVIH